MRIYFAIPPFFSLWTVIGGIFFLISKLRNFYRIVNQFVEIIASVSGQSLEYIFTIILLIALKHMRVHTYYKVKTSINQLVA